MLRIRLVCKKDIIWYRYKPRPNFCEQGVPRFAKNLHPLSSGYSPSTRAPAKVERRRRGEEDGVSHALSPRCPRLRRPPPRRRRPSTWTTLGIVDFVLTPPTPGPANRERQTRSRRYRRVLIATAAATAPQATSSKGQLVKSNPRGPNSRLQTQANTRPAR